MTAMLSSHVGRLTLNSRDDRKDITARHCDAGAMGVELKWVPLSVGIPSERGTEALDILEEKWDLVNEGIEGCGCCQCVKRNGNGRGGSGNGNGEFSILADQTEYY